MIKTIFPLIVLLSLLSCVDPVDPWSVSVYETSKSGNKLNIVKQFINSEKKASITLDTSTTHQTITGIGGSFTESSAHLLNELGAENRKDILEAYFGDTGAKYSLTRTHINSCDFSLDQYAYAMDETDLMLEKFSIEPDRGDIIPMIKEAMEISTDGFEIIASPWTAPPWMKDNKKWVGGKLLPKYYDTWALYFSKYIEAYAEEGIDIWGITVENEPLGNGNNWESMHYSAEEMTHFIVNHLGPSLEKNGHSKVNLLGYDQNRDHLKEWVDNMYADETSSQYIDGTAIHWYASTFEVFPEVLQYAHNKAPDKFLIETEGCADSEIPHWKEDEWYWSKEATDWGWDWAPEKDKHLHPKYVPVYRYARDIIGCLNNHVDGWVDWNMVLDRQGGPNWFKNWCLAPVIVDIEQDEVYYTPLYYTMAHFSKYMRPGAKRIDLKMDNDLLQATAVLNPDGNVALAILNETEDAISIDINIGNYHNSISINPTAVQTVWLEGN